jgi:hypothetical protein
LLVFRPGARCIFSGPIMLFLGFVTDRESADKVSGHDALMM